jgi:protocatechuate 3,4-dioxygenase beta subunit
MIRLHRRRLLTLVPPALWAACAPATGEGEGEEGEGEEGEGEGEGKGEGEGEGEGAAWSDAGVAGVDELDVDADFDAAVCALSCDLTLGPCFALSPERSDISEGAAGVPLVLGLRVVDVDDGCAPVADAVVDVWHCGVDGLYTGDDAVPACRQFDDEAATRRTFRGTQRTDGAGRVRFLSCFPGWYPGRAVHLHLRVTSARGTVATQLFFDDAVIASIMAEVPRYVARGLPDTDADEDLLAAEPDPSKFLLQHRQTSGGALIATKTLGVSTRGPC